MKLDVCMWTKNSAKVLSQTLRRFDQVVPSDVVGKRIVVDDHSEDDSASIAERFGWKVYANPSGGIASGANEALRHVSTPFFISIEHDILLAKEWWPKIFHHIVNEGNVAVSQGVRLPGDLTVRAILHRYIEHYYIDHSIDNNIYRTDVIRKLQGFTSICKACTDTWLKANVEAAGFRWIIDPTVVSHHLRSGIRHEISQRSRWHTACTCRRWRYPLRYLLRLTLTSPLSGLKIGIIYNAPKAFFAYPYLRLKILEGVLSGWGKGREK